MRISSRRLGEFLVSRRVLSRDAARRAPGREAADGVHLSNLLVNDEIVSEQDLMAAVASELGVPYVDLAERRSSPTCGGSCRRTWPGATWRWRSSADPTASWW